MKLKYLIIHCTATPERREVTETDIKQWHLAPADRGDGLVMYRAKIIYTNNLPDEKIGGVSIRGLRGRGWSRLGYTDLIQLDGTLINLTSFNSDDEVDYNEKTWGVAGLNGCSRHICYAGGVDKYMKPKDTRTQAQIRALIIYSKYMLMRYPDILIAGHNDFSNKACPSFKVSTWLRSIDIPEKNIYKYETDNII